MLISLILGIAITVSVPAAILIAEGRSRPFKFVSYTAVALITFGAVILSTAPITYS